MKMNHVLVCLATSTLLLGGCSIADFTSSTSDTLDTVTPDVSLNRFVDVRIASIQQEAAAGKGENLDALAQMMGKPNSAQFSSWMQAHYDELFTGLNDPVELISRIEQVELKSSI
jgi:Protein of unknown function (DUF3015)